MAKEKEQGSETAGREIVATRIINAPRELVFKVWTEPMHITQWWGPNGFTNTIHKMEVKPGGVWHFIMHGPDGVDYPNEVTYSEVVKPVRLVYSHADPKFQVTVTFEEQGNKTKLTMRMVFENAEEFKLVTEKYKAIEGQQQTLNRLEEHLAKINTVVRELTINRTFNAPLELVWDTWTDTKHIEQWWGPKGFTNPVCEWNAEVGSKILIHMKAPDGVIYPMDGEFREIIKHRKLVFVSAALNGEGKRLFEILNTITFSKENGKTNVSLHFVVSNITPEAAPHLAGMNVGWNMSLDRLGAYLVFAKQ